MRKLSQHMAKGIVLFSVPFLAHTAQAFFSSSSEPLPAGSGYIRSGDSMTSFIQQKQQALSQSQQVQTQPHFQTQPQYYSQQLATPIYPTTLNLSDNKAFNRWLNGSQYRQSEVMAYHHFLVQHLGEAPPMEQLLASARSAEKCGHEPFEVPPRHLWHNIVPTLQLLQQLKYQGLIPHSTVIRSVYRNPRLNRCAGGASESKHLTNGALDIWVPEYANQPWQKRNMVSNLCHYWQQQGQMHNFGLGLYSTGSVHIDTQGYRKWGGGHTSTSPCY